MEKLPEAAVAAAASDVPIDVICDILSYLPVKSVLRFRCVSKSWYSLINDSHFKKSHLHQSHDQVLVSRSPDEHYSFHVGPFFDDIVSGESTPTELLLTRIPNPQICNRMKFLAACDGLLLVRNCDNDLLTLSNPSTGQFRNLQDIKDDFPSSEGIHCYDFGYDSSTDDYKVLLRRETLIRSEKGNNMRRENNILSVKTNSWHKVKQFTMSCGKRAVNLNGSLNWLRRHYGATEQVWKSGVMPKIVSFSLANETLTEMEHPYYYEYFTVMDMSVLKGCICLIVIGESTGSFTIWLMKEFGETSSWTKVITLPKLRVLNATLLTVNHMNKTVFGIERRGVNGVDLLILNDLEAEEDYKIVKVTNFQRNTHLVTFSRSLISPN
ncbi:F-box protein CPR1-like [Mercurialis annua]|uniref:F-box protein CPR1-like n=1 Tax=Mercurialis annua TaxID=3986 RepID=UPI002160B4E5|nr:F-box protein CPR1-like [Mercurialis annua]